MKISAIVLLVAINLSGCSFSGLTQSQVSNDVNCFGKNYQPKSEALIESMTPRQLVDELWAVNPSKFESYEEIMAYQDSINNRIRKAGVKVLPVLTEYSDNSYKKQSAFVCDKYQFDMLSRIAWDLDRFEFRLKGTNEGKKTIEAFERALERVEKSGLAKKHVIYHRESLNNLKGINEYDVKIQETFGMRYGIKMSENELLEFSNFLINLDPTYPTWSYWDFIKDYSRINEAGNPAQVYVLKKPERFYEAHEKFKKTKR